MSGTVSGVQFSIRGDDVDMRVFRGKSIAFIVTWGDVSPIDVTGCTALLQARDPSGALMMELSTASGHVTMGGVDGNIVFSAPPAISRGCTRPGTYELELVTPGGATYRVMSGQVTIDEEVAQ